MLLYGGGVNGPFYPGDTFSYVPSRMLYLYQKL
jgi:hypothetical protein